MPMVWNACINIDECPTLAMLIKLSMDREEQLLASLATTSNSVARLVRQEVQRLNAQNPGPCQQFSSHLADIEEDYPPAETPTLSVESKSSGDKNLHKAPGKYPYPFASNQSRNTPPQPC
jgi:hypothetical protein